MSTVRSNFMSRVGCRVVTDQGEIRSDSNVATRNGVPTISNASAIYCKLSNGNILQVDNNELETVNMQGNILSGLSPDTLIILNNNRIFSGNKNSLNLNLGFPELSDSNIKVGSITVIAGNGSPESEALIHKALSAYRGALFARRSKREESASEKGNVPSRDDSSTKNLKK